MTFARYWPVGARNESEIGFTPEDMSRHLLRDWLPSVPPLGGHVLIGWPALLTETCVVHRKRFLVGLLRRLRIRAREEAPGNEQASEESAGEEHSEDARRAPAPVRVSRRED